MSENLKTKYNEAARWYEEKYVHGGWENNHYMKDEQDAYDFWMNNRSSGKIISLGVGSGQDIEILGRPDPRLFIGYDISEGMLKNARKKFPEYDFKLQDCMLKIEDNCDVLVRMFGTPNYIGLYKLLSHYIRFKASHAFFIFYNENYNDGFDESCNRYTKSDLAKELTHFNPIIQDLNENYYIVKW